MSSFFKFLQYNNAVPVALSIVLLGAGGAFAATNPEALYSTEQRVLSIDNTYIVNKDLAAFSPRAAITGVTEDEEFYYVAYDFSTIDLLEYVWRDVVKKEVMKVSKADLGPYRDLGLYVMEQLKQKLDRESEYLKEVQSIEKRNVSQKMVATAYGGLVGKLLDETTETLPGYTPVVVPPPEPDLALSGSQGSGEGTAGTQQQQALQNGKPVIQILGDNPANVAMGALYVDLGAVVSDDKDGTIALHVFVGGIEVPSVQVNTTITGETFIVYHATDSDGNVSEVLRRVVVYDPNITPLPATPETVPTNETQATTTPAENPAAETPADAAANTQAQEGAAQDTPVNPADGTAAPTETTAPAETSSSSEPAPTQESAAEAPVTPPADTAQTQ